MSTPACFVAWVRTRPGRPWAEMPGTVADTEVECRYWLACRLEAAVAQLRRGA